MFANTPAEKLTQLNILKSLLVEAREDRSSIAIDESIHSVTLTLSADEEFKYQDNRVTQIYMVGNVINKSESHISENFKVASVRFIFQFDNNTKMVLRIKNCDDIFDNASVAYKILRSCGGIPEDTFSRYGTDPLPPRSWLVPDKTIYTQRERMFYDKAHLKCVELLIQEIKKNPTYLVQAEKKGVTIISLGCGDGHELVVCESLFNKTGLHCQYIGLDFNLDKLQANQRKYENHLYLPLDMEHLDTYFPKVMASCLPHIKDRFIIMISSGGLNRSVLSGTYTSLLIKNKFAAHGVGNLFIETGWTQSLTCKRSAKSSGWEAYAQNYFYGDNHHDFSHYRLIYISHRINKETRCENVLAKSMARIRHRGFTTLDLSEIYDTLDQCQMFIDKKPELVTGITQVDLSWSHFEASDVPSLITLLNKFTSLKIIIISNQEPWADTLKEALKTKPIRQNFQLIQRMDSPYPKELPIFSLEICRELKIFSTLPNKTLLKVTQGHVEEFKDSTSTENCKKLMCVQPYEGFVCKREGLHAGVAMPNFNTSFAVIIITDKSFFALHYPSRTYSKQLPHHFKKWTPVFKEPIVKALLVTNKSFDDFGSAREEPTALHFKTKLNADTGLTFIIQEENAAIGNNLLIIKTDGTITLIKPDLELHKNQYDNFPIKNPFVQDNFIKMPPNS